MNKENFCKLYLVRHGQTDWNIQKKLIGQTDVPLNAVGEAQSADLAKELQSIHFDFIFSSDLIRTMKTAEIATAERNLAIATSKLLRERSYGKHEGQPSEIGYEIEAVITAWEKAGKKDERPYPEVESNEEIVTRLITFLREVSIEYPGKSILIVTHAGMLRWILVHLGWISAEEMPKIENACYLKLLSDGVDFFIDEMKGISKQNSI